MCMSVQKKSPLNVYKVHIQKVYTRESNNEPMALNKSTILLDS